MGRSARRWSLADAKAQLSAVVDRAQHEGAQVITRRGKAAVVVLSAEDYAQLKAQQGRLSDFLAHSPLKGLQDLDLERVRDSARELEL